jgi:RNA polymerase sporulation-specific sigma factor
VSRVVVRRAAYGGIDDGTARRLLDEHAVIIAAALKRALPMLRRTGALLDKDDLRTIAQMALFCAHLTFDETHGVKFTTWAQRCVQDQLKNAIHDARRYASHHEALERPEFVHDQRDPEAELIRVDFVRRVERVMAELPPRRRSILVLRAGGERQEDIGKSLGICRVRVSQEETAAKTTIREVVTREGLDLGQ